MDSFNSWRSRKIHQWAKIQRFLWQFCSFLTFLSVQIWLPHIPHKARPREGLCAAVQRLGSLRASGDCQGQGRRWQRQVRPHAPEPGALSKGWWISLKIPLGHGEHALPREHHEQGADGRLAGQEKTRPFKWVQSPQKKYRRKTEVMFRISISNLPEKPINGEEMAISRVGKELFEMLIKPYTKKQWNKYPSVSRDCRWSKQNKQLFQFQELDAEVFTRLPYRENRDDRLYTRHMTDVFESFALPRYFDDPWQHLPKDGYTRMFENMLLKVGLRSWTILLKFFYLRIPRSQFGWQLTTLRWIL